MKLVVQMPALNEEKTIVSVIQGIPRDIPGIDKTAVLVVDDGSTDRTGELARQAGAEVVRHERPRGVGMAFRTGLERSAELGADILVTIDSDGQIRAISPRLSSRSSRAKRNSSPLPASPIPRWPRKCPGPSDGGTT